MRDEGDTLVGGAAILALRMSEGQRERDNKEREIERDERNKKINMFADLNGRNLGEVVAEAVVLLQTVRQLVHLPSCN